MFFISLERFYYSTGDSFYFVKIHGDMMEKLNNKIFIFTFDLYDLNVSNVQLLV